MLDVHFFSSCRAPISIRQDYNAFRRVKTLKDGGLFPANPSYLRGLIDRSCHASCWDVFFSKTQRTSVAADLSRRIVLCQSSGHNRCASRQARE
jgi:hypothetical protein